MKTENIMKRVIQAVGNDEKENIIKNSKTVNNLCIKEFKIYT